MAPGWNTPFWRASFVLQDPKDIVAIHASSIKEVWIDRSKGLDAPAGQAVVSEAQSEAQVDPELKAIAQSQRATSAVSGAVEIERATKICRQAKKAVMSMFLEARMGKTVDAAGVQPMAISNNRCSRPL